MTNTNAEFCPPQTAATERRLVRASRTIFRNKRQVTRSSGRGIRNNYSTIWEASRRVVSSQGIAARGNGQAAVGLASVFDRVIATDGSEKQIANAQENKR